MSSKSRSTVVRTLLLIGLMGGLGGVLFWQKREEFAAARQQNAADLKFREENFQKRLNSEQRYDIGIETLADRRRPEAETATQKIADLRKQRTDASRWPHLIVPTPPNAQTKETIQADYLQYRLRELEAYRRETRDTGDAKTAGEAFLDAYLRQVANRDQQDGDYQRLCDLGRVAVEAGSRDPMLRTYLAVCDWTVTSDRAAAVAEWEAALKELPQTKYPRIVQSYARLFLRDQEVDLFSRKKRWLAALPAIREWLEEEAASPQWIRSTWERLWSIWESVGTSERLQLTTECSLSTTIDPCIPHTLLGIHLIDRAWSQRGGGWAIDVKPEQWDGFEKYLKQAATHLQYAWVLHPELPRAAEKMIPIAMAGGDSERPYFWFLRAIEARFDDYAAYENLGYALTSRWSGSRRDLYAFGHNCVETLRFDTLVPYHAVDMLQRVKRFELEEGESLASDPDALKLLRRFLELRKAYRSDPAHQPMFEDSGRYRSDLLLLMEECGLYDEAAELLRETAGNLNWTRLRNNNRRGRFLAARRMAIQGPLGERVLSFDQRLQEPWREPVDPAVFDQLEAECRALKAEIGAIPNLRADFPDYFAHAEVMIAQKRGYNSGEWFSLDLSPSLAGWEPYVDRWWVDEEKRVTLSGRDGYEDQIALRPLMDFPPPFAVEADLEILEPAPYLGGAGIGWSREDVSNYELSGGLPYFYTTVTVDRFRRKDQDTRRDLAQYVVRIARYSQPSNFHPLPDQTTHHLHVNLWPECGEYQADNACYEARLNEPLATDGWLCFGQTFPQGTNLPEKRGAVRFSNLRLRRLSIPAPPPVTEPLDDRTAYWEARYAKEPNSNLVQARMIGIRTEQFRNSEAMALAESLLERAPEIFQIRRWKAIVLARQRRYAEALRECSAVVDEWKGDYDNAWRYAEILAAAPDESLRNGKHALALATSAVSHFKDHRDAFQALAAAHAEMGEFDKAVETQLRAVDAEADVADAFTPIRLEQYRAGQPWRLPGPAVAP